jgi:hypothetical protein
VAGSMVTPSSAGNPMQSNACGANTRAGRPCPTPGMRNGRCRMHGSCTPVGSASGAFKTGRYSKYMPKRLLERYEEAMGDPNLLALADEIALVDARAQELVEQLDASAGPERWSDLLALFDQRRKLAEAERKRLQAFQTTITTQEALCLVQTVLNLNKDHVSDKAERDAITRELARVAGIGFSRQTALRG